MATVDPEKLREAKETIADAVQSVSLAEIEKLVSPETVRQLEAVADKIARLSLEAVKIAGAELDQQGLSGEEAGAMHAALMVYFNCKVQRLAEELDLLERAGEGAEV
jgi:hypothetical protein